MQKRKFDNTGWDNGLISTSNLKQKNAEFSILTNYLPMHHWLEWQKQVNFIRSTLHIWSRCISFNVRRQNNVKLIEVVVTSPYHKIYDWYDDKRFKWPQSVTWTIGFHDDNLLSASIALWRGLLWRHAERITNPISRDLSLSNIKLVDEKIASNHGYIGIIELQLSPPCRSASPDTGPTLGKVMGSSEFQRKKSLCFAFRDFNGFRGSWAIEIHTY